MTFEPVEVFDVGPARPGGDGAPPPGSGRDVEPGQDRAAGGIAATLALAAVMVALVGLVTAVGVWRHRSRTVTSVHTIAAGSPVSVDASGCPTGQSCTITSGPLRLSAAVRTWDPRATLVTGSDVRTSSGVAVRSTLIAETSVAFANGSPLERAQSVLTVVAQCVPGGAALSSSQRSDATRLVQSVTVAGPIGCSVTVTSVAEDGVAVPIDSLADLARSPGLQL